MLDLKDPALTPARRPGWLMDDKYIQKPSAVPHWSDRLVSDLGLPPKATQLLGEKFRTFGAVDRAGDDELLTIKGVGPAMVERIRTALAAWKWQPGGED
jgi:hypothetical protein